MARHERHRVGQRLVWPHLEFDEPCLRVDDAFDDAGDVFGAGDGVLVAVLVPEFLIGIVLVFEAARALDGGWRRVGAHEANEALAVVEEIYVA